MATRRINFKQYEKQEADLRNSEVRKALQEAESGESHRGVAGLSELQEDRQYQSKDYRGWCFILEWILICLSGEWLAHHGDSHFIHRFYSYSPQLIFDIRSTNQPLQTLTILVQFSLGQKTNNVIHESETLKLVRLMDQEGTLTRLTPT